MKIATKKMGYLVIKIYKISKVKLEKPIIFLKDPKQI